MTALPEGLTAVIFALTYILFLLSVGEFARRKSKQSREDYFLASRKFGGFLLFFSVLGTVASAFTILGFPGEVYRSGLANFGAIAGSAILLIPITFATCGVRMWLAGKKFNLITPSQLLNHRYDSDILGLILSLFMIVWTIPYLVLGGIGAGIAFEFMTGGLISYSLGAGIVLSVVTVYLIFGGMRGSGYTDVIQGILMLLLMTGFTAYIASHLGGFSSAMASSAEVNLDLLSREGEFTTEIWLSSLLMMGLSVLMYPHVMLRVFSGSSIKSLKKMFLFFPAGMFVLFSTSALLGFWGQNQISGLTGEAADRILPELLTAFAPEYLAATALVVILAALMSSLDSQTLSISTLISEDFLRDIYGMDDDSILSTSKVLTGLIMSTVFVLTLIQPGTIFFLVEFAFQGYALLFYPVVIGLYWRKATEAGVIVGLVSGFVGLWLFQLGIIPSNFSFGFMPLAPLLLIQVFLTHITSHFTEPPSEEKTDTYFKVFTDAW